MSHDKLLAQLEGTQVIVCDPGRDAHELVMGTLHHEDLCLYERSEGALTHSLYDSLWRELLVTVPATELAHVLQSTRTSSSADLVRSFFERRDAHLSSFMDLLDALHARYGFEVLLDDGAPAVMVP
jgi:hypothetical protein